MPIKKIVLSSFQVVSCIEGTARDIFDLARLIESTSEKLSIPMRFGKSYGNSKIDLIRQFERLKERFEAVYNDLQESAHAILGRAKLAMHSVSDTNKECNVVGECIASIQMALESLNQQMNRLSRIFQFFMGQMR